MSDDIFDSLKSAPETLISGDTKAKTLALALAAFDESHSHAINPKMRGQTAKAIREDAKDRWKLWRLIMAFRGPVLPIAGAVGTSIVFGVSVFIWNQNAENGISSSKNIEISQIDKAGLENPALQVKNNSQSNDNSTAQSETSRDVHALEDETIGKGEKGTENEKEVIASEESKLDTVMTSPSSEKRSILISESVMPTMSAQSLDVGVIMPFGPNDSQGTTFESFDENPIKIVLEEPVSTFSIDVDTASYSIVRNMLNRGIIPEKDAVRVEELINYFDYDYAKGTSLDAPFEVRTQIVPAPWNSEHQLLHIAVAGYAIEEQEKPPVNLVFLVDVSGSMNQSNKLPLLVQSLKLLLNKLEPEDTIGVVTYAGQAGIALQPTPVAKKDEIIEALDNLTAGGSTAGSKGIETAYQLAAKNFDEKAVNRVILATDGDFNVGLSDPDQLTEFIAEKRDSGIYLSVLGFGDAYFNDAVMQQLAQNGNGVAAHIDTLNEARKLLVEEATSSLFPIARDVKIQVEFNPNLVSEYRLIGYETRALRREDFNNDKIDAGDIGSGHRVTAIYELTPKGAALSSDKLRYQTQQPQDNQELSPTERDEFAFVKLRYKKPDEDVSLLLSFPVTKEMRLDDLMSASSDLRFSVAVAAFGQLLRNDDYMKDYTFEDILPLAVGARGEDPFNYRGEFISLLRLAMAISSR